MTEVILNVDEHFIYPASEIICCRICHEAEFESCKSLESPCSCSGTVKFAHRDCVQRWCDEKGNTNCEICLQKFEPGYSASTPSKQNHETDVPIRERLEVPRTDENLEAVVIVDEEETLVERELTNCSSVADTTISLWRNLALIFTMLLLGRHFIGVLVGETGDYPFTLLTLIVIKACGILLPMYTILRMIDMVHNIITHQYPDLERGHI